MADDLTVAVDRALVLAATEMLAGQWDGLAERAAEYTAAAGFPVSGGQCRARVERALGEALAAQRAAVAAGAGGGGSLSGQLP